MRDRLSLPSGGRTILVLSCVFLVPLVSSLGYAEELEKYVGLARSHSESLVNGVAHGVYEDYQLGRGTNGITPEGQYLKRTIEFDYAFDAAERCFRVDSRYLALVNIAADEQLTSETIVEEPFPGGFEAKQCQNFYHDTTKVAIEVPLWSGRFCQVTTGVQWREPYVDIPTPDSLLFDPSFTMRYLDYIKSSELRATQRDNYYRRLFIESSGADPGVVVIRQDKLAVTQLGTQTDPRTVYDLVTHKFYLDPERGYLRRFQLLRKAYRQSEFADAFVLEGKQFQLARQIPEPLLHIDLTFTHDPHSTPPFPTEILRRDYLALPDASSPVISLQRRIRFDQVQLNQPDFTAADFFPYPEFNVDLRIKSSAQENHPTVPLSPEQYLSFFSDLTLDFSRVVIRNPWLFEEGTR